jgi:hypothetical protein
VLWAPPAVSCWSELTFFRVQSLFLHISVKPRLLSKIPHWRPQERGAPSRGPPWLFPRASNPHSRIIGPLKATLDSSLKLDQPSSYIQRSTAIAYLSSGSSTPAKKKKKKEEAPFSGRATSLARFSDRTTDYSLVNDSRTVDSTDSTSGRVESTPRRVVIIRDPRDLGGLCTLIRTLHR